MPLDLLQAARASWDEVDRAAASSHGLRNSQITVLAPTGTIAFMMDCDTTGVEPDIALVKYKKLVGGGMIKIVNKTVPLALKRLGYDKDADPAPSSSTSTSTTPSRAPPHLKDEHLPVFDCAFKPANGTRSIHYMGHLRMMARGAAVHLGRDLEDHQHARGLDRRGHRATPTSRAGSWA